MDGSIMYELHALAAYIAIAILLTVILWGAR